MSIISQAPEITAITGVNLDNITRPVAEQYDIAAKIRQRIPSQGDVNKAALNTVLGGAARFEENYAQLSEIATRSAAAGLLRNAQELASDAASKADESTPWKILAAHHTWLAAHKDTLEKLSDKPIDNADNAISGKASTAYTAADTITNEIERFLGIITSAQTISRARLSDPLHLIIDFPEVDVAVWRDGNLYENPAHAEDLAAMRDYLEAHTTRERLIIAARAGWDFTPAASREDAASRGTRINRSQRVRDTDRGADRELNPNGTPGFTHGPSDLDPAADSASRQWSVRTSGNKLTTSVQYGRRK